MNEVCEAATITPKGSATLPFVIPSAAEGSAVSSFGCNEFVIPTGAQRSGMRIMFPASNAKIVACSGKYLRPPNKHSY
jgi:hypothetical protein